MKVFVSSSVADVDLLRQEVGRVRAKDKPVVPLVSSDVKPEDLGRLNGVIYHPISRDQTQQALAGVARVIEGMKLKKAEEQRQLLMVGGIVGLLWLFGNNG